MRVVLSGSTSASFPSRTRRRGTPSAMSRSQAASSAPPGNVTVDGSQAANSITNSYATGAVTARRIQLRRRSRRDITSLAPSRVRRQRRGDGRCELDRRAASSVINFTGASITNSFANSAVLSAEINVQLGGLVGENDPGATIVNSQAYGAVTSTASLPPQNNNSDCSLSGSCTTLSMSAASSARTTALSRAPYGRLRRQIALPPPPAPAAMSRSAHSAPAAASPATTKASSNTRSPPEM